MKDERLILETQMSGTVIFNNPLEIVGFGTPASVPNYTLHPDGATIQTYMIEILPVEETIHMHGSLEELTEIYSKLKTYTNKK